MSTDYPEWMSTEFLEWMSTECLEWMSTEYLAHFPQTFITNKVDIVFPEFSGVRNLENERRQVVLLKLQLMLGGG